MKKRNFSFGGIILIVTIVLATIVFVMEETEDLKVFANSEGFVEYLPYRYGDLSTNLNFREGPGTEYKVIETIKTDKRVLLKGYVIEGNEKWYKATIEGITGYLISDYVIFSYQEYNSPAKMLLTNKETLLKSDVDAREGAEVLDTIPLDSKITVHGYYRTYGPDWIKVTYNGKTGYISSADTKTYEQVVEYSPYRYVDTKASLNLKSGPGNEYSTIGKVGNGDRLLCYGYTKYDGIDGWYKVKVGSEIGYIDADYVKLSYQAYSITRTLLANKEVDLKSGLGNGYGTLDIIPLDSKITVHGYYRTYGPDWIKVTYNGKTGYISSTDTKTYEQVVEYSPYRYVDTKASLNLKSGPGNEYSIIGKVGNGDRLLCYGYTKYDGIDGWYKVKVGSEIGYIDADYVKLSYQPYSPTRTLLANKEVELKSGLGNGYSTLDIIPLDAKITVHGYYRTYGPDWIKVTYNGKTGYISSVDTKTYEEVVEYSPYRYVDTKASLNLKSGPGNEYSTIGNVGSGDRLLCYGYTKYGGIDGWYKVKVGNKIGYLDADYTKLSYQSYSPQRNGVASKSIELKSGVGEGYRTIDTINPDLTMTVYGYYRVYGPDWIKVKYNGQVGYISSEYVKISKAPVFGIDVSMWNGDLSTTDWEKIKEDGVDFAIIRVGGRFGSSGTIYNDDEFIQNMKGAYAAGIDVGVYFYTQAITTAEAVQEAEYTLRKIKESGVPITMPIAYDTEHLDNGRHNNLSRQARTNVADAFCSTIEKAGYDAMIYSNLAWLEDDLYMNQLTEYETWVAQYWTATLYMGKYNFNHDYKTSYDGTYEYWQYTSSGTIDGISGRVDLNWWYPGGIN